MHTHFGASPKKIFEKIYPFTCSNWEVQNYRVFLKNFLSGKKPSHLFGIERSKRTLFFRKKAKNFFEKTICLKNIPSLVPTGRGHLGIVIQKKGKKICPPGVAGRDIAVKEIPAKQRSCTDWSSFFFRGSYPNKLFYSL